MAKERTLIARGGKAVLASFPFSFVILASCSMGCAGHARSTPAAMTFPTVDISAQSRPYRKLWSRRANGAISDLSFSGSGRALLVATSPDPDVVGSASRHLLTRYNSRGKIVWRKVVHAPVKSQAISFDGAFVALSNYDDEVIALDGKGKELWTTEGLCRPIILSKGKRVICYHDDDAEPEIAFDVYSWDGQKLFSFPITSDVLALRVSEDERSIALGLTGGQVLLVKADLENSKFPVAWTRRVDYEVVDLGVSSGDHPRLAVLSAKPEDSTADSRQLVTLFDENGKTIGESRPEAHVDQVAMSPSGSDFALYGNSEQGQYVSYFTVNDSGAASLQRKWEKGSPRYADYTSSIFLAPELLFWGFEDVEDTTRSSRLLVLDLEGKPLWNLALTTEEGSYVYARGVSENAAILAVGTDDGVLSEYRLKK